MRSAGIPHPHLPLPEAGQGEDLEAFHLWLGKAIPLVAHLGLRKIAWQDEVLVWELALAPNLNDKGTGFGGSLTAQSTLIGWCWITLWLRAQGRQQDVVVTEASQRFLAPVRSDFRLECCPQDQYAAAGLSEQLADRGKGRITLVQRLYCGQTLCLEASGDYAVLPAR